jgi:3-hydroxy-9,10-secoandrosta-1,3,5(10)-triene-9,17-dione monooxygenase
MISTSQVSAIAQPDLEAGARSRILVERAIALRPDLRARQAEVEITTGISEEIHTLFREAGFYRILQPRRFGGYELDLRCFSDVVREVARGCPSSGWNLCLAASHALVVGGLFGEEVQAEVFGDGDFRAPLPVAPTGVATRTEDGYVVRGRWDYASGINVATHFLAGTLVDDGDGRPPHMGVVIVPSGWKMLDNWGVILGLRGSGSNSVVVDGVNVPERFVSHANLFDLDLTDGTPGSRLHGNPMYAGQMMSFFNIQIVSIMVGLAWAAVDEFETILRTKQTAIPPFRSRSLDPELQRILGRAMAMTDAAQRVIGTVADEYLAIASRGASGREPFTTLDDNRMSVAAREAGQLAAQAVEMIASTSGTSSLADGQRIQRYLRDTYTYKSHFNAQHDRHAAAFARQFLGVPEP